MKRTIGRNAQDRRRARRAANRRNRTGELSASDVRDIAGLAAEALVTLGASGSTSLPLSDQGAAWDAGAAAKGLQDGDLAKAYFWKDPDGDASSKSSYKLGFAQRVGGTLTAIWRGVTAAAGAIQGARGGVDIPQADVAGVKAKIASYYEAVAKKYDDPNIKPPWEANESAGQSAAFLLAYAECAEISGLDRHYAEVDGEEILIGVGGAGEGMDQFLMVLSYWEKQFAPDADLEDFLSDAADELGGKPNQGTKPDKRLKENKGGKSNKPSDDDNPEMHAIDAVDEYAASVKCGCGHPFSEHNGAGGSCGHEDGRGTCRCGEFAYPDAEVSALADAILAARPDLAEFGSDVMRIAQRVMLAAADTAWDKESSVAQLFSEISERTGGRAVDLSLDLDRVVVEDGKVFFIVPIAIDALGDPVVADRADWHLVTDEEFLNGWQNRDFFAPTVEIPEPAEVVPAGSGDEPEITPAAAPVSGEIPWHATFLPEGKLTEDGRSFAPGSVILPPDEQARQLPLTLMAMIKTSAEGGHDGAEVAGRIDSLYRDAPLIEADGVFSKEEYGQMIARMVGSEELTGLSVDIAPLEYEWVPRAGWFDDSGNWIAVQNDAGEWEAAPGFEEVEDEPDSIEAWLRGADDRVLVITKAVIGMATVCPFPAFGDASIALTAAGMPKSFQWMTKIEVSHDSLVAAGLAEPCVECQEAEVLRYEYEPVLDAEPVEVITAAAAGLTPTKPPAEWFADPELAELTPMTITDDGRIFGHAWQWETCHLSFDTCVVAPHSETNYAYFMLGEIECEGGDRLAVGKITIDTGHAGTRMSRLDAVRHYDDTGTVAAYVCFGEDEHGGWFAGAVAPDLSEDTVVALRGSTPSGDWRGVDGNLELVAILAVNVPGFPVPRGLVAAGADGEPEPVSLIAAGAVTDSRLAAIKRLIDETLAGEPLAGGQLVPASLTELIRQEIAEITEPES